MHLATACLESNPEYNPFMSANDLLEKVKHLRGPERRKFFHYIHELEDDLAHAAPRNRKRPVRWPDAAARRRRIFGSKVLPNLVLLAREEERF